MAWQDTVLALEQGFWQASFDGDGAWYAEHLAEDAVLVFPPPAGVLDKAACVGIVSGRPADVVRWGLSELRFSQLAEGVVALTYRGLTERDPGVPRELDRRSSVYRDEGGRWRLVLHHVTPEGAAGGSGTPQDAGGP